MASSAERCVPCEDGRKLLVGALLARVAWAKLRDDAVEMTCLATAMAVPVIMQLRPMRIDHHGWQVVLALVALNGLAAGVRAAPACALPLSDPNVPCWHRQRTAGLVLLHAVLSFADGVTGANGHSWLLLVPRRDRAP